MVSKACQEDPEHSSSHLPSGLDILSVGEPLTTIPANVLAVDWDEIVYLEPVVVRVTGPGYESTFNAADMSLTIDRANCTTEQLRVLAEKDGVT